MIDQTLVSRLGLTVDFKNPKETEMSDEAKCPFPHGAAKQNIASAHGNANWWPNQLNL